MGRAMATGEAVPVMIRSYETDRALRQAVEIIPTRAKPAFTNAQ